MNCNYAHGVSELRPKFASASGYHQPMMTQPAPRTDKSGTTATTTDAVLTDKAKVPKLQE